MSNASKARDPQACAHFKDLFGRKVSSGEDARAVPQRKIVSIAQMLACTLEAGAKALEPGHRPESFSISPGIAICFWPRSQPVFFQAHFQPCTQDHVAQGTLEYAAAAKGRTRYSGQRRSPSHRRSGQHEHWSTVCYVMLPLLGKWWCLVMLAGFLPRGLAPRLACQSTTKTLLERASYLCTSLLLIIRLCDAWPKAPTGRIKF